MGHPLGTMGIISPQMWSDGFGQAHSHVHWFLKHSLESHCGFQCVLRSCKGHLDWLRVWSTDLVHSSLFYAEPTLCTLADSPFCLNEGNVTEILSVTWPGMNLGFTTQHGRLATKS